MILNQVHPKQWKLVSPGLCGHQGTISFQSATNANNYLRHRNFLIYEDPFTNTHLYKNDACFHRRNGKYFFGFDAFESVNYPGRFIRHQHYRLKLHAHEDAALFMKDASFRFLYPITCIGFQSRNYPIHFWGLKNNDAYIDLSSQYQWIVVSPGLTGHPHTVSFRACNDATKYLRHANFNLQQHSFHDSTLYRLDATFIEHKNKWFHQPFTYWAYESINFPLHFIRHQNFRLKISDFDGSVRYREDATFRKTRQYNP